MQVKNDENTADQGNIRTPLYFDFSSYTMHQNISYLMCAECNCIVTQRYKLLINISVSYILDK